MKDDTEQLYIKKLGEQPGKIAAHIQARWVYAYSRYYELHKMATHEGIEGLPEFMGGAYLRIRDMLWQDTVLTIAKLTDPTEQGHEKQHKNLTVRWLPNICENTPIHGQLLKQVKNINKLARPVHKWRSQVYAHTELTKAIYPKSRQLAYVDLQKLDDLLQAIHAPINTVWEYCIPNNSLSHMVLDNDPYHFLYFLGNTLGLVKGAKFIHKHIDPLTSDKGLPQKEAIYRFLRLIGADDDDVDSFMLMLNFFAAIHSPSTQKLS